MNRRVLGIIFSNAVRPFACKEQDTFDQLGQALKQQQAKAGRNQQVGGPAHQPAGVAGHFTRMPGGGEKSPAQVDDKNTERDQDDNNPGDVHQVASPRSQAGGNEVDTNMAVMQKCVASSQEKDSRIQVPLSFQHAVGAQVKGLASDGVAGAQNGGGQQ